MTGPKPTCSSLLLFCRSKGPKSTSQHYDVSHAAASCLPRLLTTVAGRDSQLGSMCGR